ncbi:MAG: 2,3-bisphosphoglycerate-independent phosphoglycerate mutase [Elusimicrobiota bacterium]|jgi:2,3-bisphosphoglycerate-independent phosphoglycerate mutase|nr:2,3-bisphosphoglycerate-independent phosphoglycerate mutase [Elusimicrobiota bacterium]
MSKVVLIIRDGWGARKDSQNNAIAQAKTPNIDRYLKQYPNTLIEASGESVGLPAGYMGSSEVGHLNMGAGRIVVQELKRLKDAFEDGSIYKAEAFKNAIENCIKNNSALHLMGLVQDEGVHAHQDHLYAIIKYAAGKGIKTIWVHFFADGRDTPPTSALGYLKMLEEKMKEYQAGKVATLMGRYYAMDRNETWQLTSEAYDLIVDAKGRHVATAEDAIKNAYETGKSPDGSPMVDEYIPPTVIADYNGLKDNDSLIFFNFRQDRAIQLTKAFVDDDFSGPRSRRPKITYCGLTKYYDSFGFSALPPMTEGGGMEMLLGEVISKQGLRQLRLAETQKFKHVTSFFNGKLIKPFEGEEQVEIKGSFDPATFAEHPQMDALPVAKKAIEEITKNKYDFIAINFANCDMVGHTGNMQAVVKAAEVVDDVCGQVAEAALKAGYVALITADHGNAEEMWDTAINMPKTAHTTNPVELIYLANDTKGIELKSNGKLADIAPTILQILGIKKPKEMTAESLLK